jgi:hypothetical protein
LDLYGFDVRTTVGIRNISLEVRQIVDTIGTSPSAQVKYLSSIKGR